MIVTHNKHKRYERGIEKKKTKKTEWERKMLCEPIVPLFSRRSFWNASKDDDEEDFWCCFFPSTPVGENLKFSDIIIALNIIKRRLILKSTKEKNEERTALCFAALFVPLFFDDFFDKSRVRLRDIIIII